MNRTLSRHRLGHQAEPGRRSRRTGRHRVHPLLLEPLEARTLLSGLDWTQVGTGVESIFTQLQTSVNNHLLAPNKVQYSLPLVGNQLGQLSDPVGQVFAGLASNQIAAAFQQPPKNADGVKTALKTALQAFNPTITKLVDTASEATFAVQASATTSTTPPLSEQVALQLGLPGLGLFLQNVAANQAVNASLTFSINLTFGIDASGVFVDPTQNSATSPLLQVEVKADLSGFSGVAADLNGVPVQITDNSRNPSHLDVPVAFNSSATAPIHSFNATNIDQFDFASTAEGDANLRYALNVANALTLTADLGVKWPLKSTTPHVSPFDSLSDGQVPTVTLEAGADLGSLVNELNPASSPVIQELDKDIKPLKDVVDFFYKPLPVLSDLGITVTPRGLLGDFLPDKYKGFLQALDAFHDVLDAVGTFSFPQGTQVNFASSTLPSTVDPRTLLPGGVVSAFETNAQQEASNIQNTVDPFLQSLGNALDGTIQLPILADPSLAFEALLTNDNVALFQYTINPINFGAGMPPDAPINLGPPIGPIVPPFPIFLQLTAGFGLTAGFTIGYSTWGFHNAAPNKPDDPLLGLFLANASAQLKGQFGISGELDVGVLQAGANGSVDLSLGVTGINTGTGAPHMGAPYTHSLQTVDQNNNTLTETVLQLDDFKNDVTEGGPFCPFIVGGSLGLSLSVFVTIGIDPFSISFDYPLGDITLFDFSCPSCQPPAIPTLAETFVNPDPSKPPIAGLPVSDILNKQPGTTQLVVLDMGDYASRRQNVNDSGATSEDFEISLPTDATGIQKNALVVQAFGAVQEINGIDSPNTTIVAIADGKLMPESIKVDPGILANAYFTGGSLGNHFEYLGKGNTSMKGGTWNPSLGDPSHPMVASIPLPPVQTLNTLQGGFGRNTLVGGDLSTISGSGGYDAEKAAQWNVLIANPAEVLGQGQDGGQQDTLQAGTAGATMKGGALGGDTFQGSSDPVAGTDPKSVHPSVHSQYVMIAGKDDNHSGPDTMDGGYGQYRFEWQEGAAPLTVDGNSNGYQPSGAELDVWGTQGFETWVIDPATGGVHIHGQDAKNNALGPIDAYGVPTVSVDAEQEVSPTDHRIIGGETYTVNDMGRTGVTRVNVNLHQWLTNADVNADHIVVNGPTGNDTVDLSTRADFTGNYDQNGLPIYSNQWTEMSISDQADNILTYYVDTAVPKSSDTLNLNTFAGNDTVGIKATQPDQTSVSTGGGNDAITVGGGGSSLDDIEGPLIVDAGPGQNQITFDDSASTNADIVTLTTSLKPAGNPSVQGRRNALAGPISLALTDPVGYVFRYKGEALPASSVEGRPAYRYPLGITFLAGGGGNFAQGVTFRGTQSTHPDQIYVDSVLPQAPTTVRTLGLNDEVYAGFDGGLTGATSDPNSTLDNLDSPLTVIDQTGATTDLRVDDEGTARADTYAVSAGQVTRQKALSLIQYQSLGALEVVAAASQNNIIDVTGTALGTSTTVDAGNGNNTISVEDSSHRLDELLGLLTINGGAGTDPLSVDDSGNGSAQSYQLTASTLTRTGPPPIQISFHQISSLAFHASENTGTNNITVSGTPAGVPVTIVTGGGNAALTVSSLDNIQGALTFQWVTGTKSLVVLDLTAAENAVYQVLPNQIQRTGAATIQFDYTSFFPFTTDPLASITVAAGQLHGAEVDVPGTIKATPVALYLGAATNQVVVSAAQESLDSIQGQLTIGGFFVSGTTAAILDDQKGPAGRTYSLGGSLQFNPSLPPIQFSGLSGVTLNAATASTASVLATAAGQAVTLNLGAGPNAVAVGSPSQQLKSIQAPLTVNGQTGTNQLTLQDQGTPPSLSAYTLTPSSVSRPGATVNYSHMTAVQLDGSPGMAYQVQGVDPGTQVSLSANGLGNVLIGPNTTSTWQVAGKDAGTLDTSLHFADIGTLEGGAGNNTFNVLAGASLSSTLYGGGGTNTLVGPATPSTWQIAGKDLGFLVGSLQFVNVGNLVGGAGNNTFLVFAGTSLSGTLSGGGGTNTLVGPNTTNTWSITGTNSGNLDGAIAFASVQNLTGGTGLDAFVFAAGSGVTGTINGGGGGDWLDYAASTTPVAVNLSAGTATGVGGGIAHIQDVRGGQAGNTLTGNAQGNILIGGAGADTIQGGSGRSILIGDKGPDTITAGSGDTILIGGYTDFDSSSIAHDQALESILAEWQSANTYATRISHIKSGGGLNGPNRLIWGVTVHDDGSANTLVGGAGMDWFFAGVLDTIKNRNPVEQVN